MRLVLTGDGLPRQTKLLSSGTLSLGRGPGNDWVLPDPDRHLSKTHCVVSVERGQYVLTDLSTNGVYVNGAAQPTQRDSRIVLTPGDEFRLGTYVVRLEEGDGGPAAYGAHLGDGFGDGHDGIDGRGVDEGRSPLDIDPLDDPLGRPPDPAFRHPVAHVPASQRSQDPFDVAEERNRRGIDREADLFGGVAPSPLWQGAAQRDDADAPAHAFTPPRVVSRPPPADPFRGSASQPAPGGMPGGAPGNIDFDALIGDLSPVMPGAAPAQPFAEPPRGAPMGAPMGAPVPAPPTPAPAAAPSAGTPRQAAADPFGSLDDLLGDAPPAPVPAQPPAAEAPARTPLPYAPPAVAAPVQPVAAPPAAAPAAGPVAAHPAAPNDGGSRGDGGQAALAAFLAGAGLDRLPSAAGGDPDAVLRAAGEVFRAMTEGLREVLMSRAAIKGEMRVEQTMIRARDNNALKFSITPDDAVAALLGSARPGYMPPLAAAREAFADIKSHELAVMAGVQDALVALLRRFDPEALEKRLASGLLDSVLPAARKARLWDGFRQVYGDIAKEAEDDFQAVFGREFARAYAAQARKE